MRLKRASAWYYNKGKTHVVINELGIMLRQGAVVDLFKLNPSLTWEQFQRSATTGVLAQKSHVLIRLPGPPKASPPSVSLPVSTQPIASRNKSSLLLGRDNEDYLASIESEFSSDLQPLAQQEMWKVERDKYLTSLNELEQGENGEVFSDALFDEEYLDNLTD